MREIDVMEMIGVGLAQPQIIGMSATLANIEDLLKFLDAQFYEERFRPVELEEYVKINEDVYKIDRNLNELVAHRQIDFKVSQKHFSPKDFLLHSSTPNNIYSMILID